LTNIFDLYNFVNYITDKYRNGYLSPEEVSECLDAGQTALWNHHMGERQKGNELSLIALKPFKKISNVTSTYTGKAASPSMYAETEGVFETIGSKTVSIKQVLTNELDYALSSGIYPIAQYPRFIEDSDGLQIYPKATHNVEWHYIARPNTPVIGYTNNVNQVIYDPTTSTQLDFAPQYWNDVVSLALPYIGVNLSNAEVVGLEQLFNINKDNGNDSD
jgi:hypothetical protein